jgi:hypothetical protein
MFRKVIFYHENSATHHFLDNEMPSLVGCTNMHQIDCHAQIGRRLISWFINQPALLFLTEPIHLNQASQMDPAV